MNSISVSALNTIFQKWEISANSNQWNISGEPCSGAAIDDSIPFDDENHNPFIKCECSSNSTCHIIQLYVSLLYILMFCFSCQFCLDLQFLYIFFKKEIIKLHSSCQIVSTGKIFWHGSIIRLGITDVEIWLCREINHRNCATCANDCPEYLYASIYLLGRDIAVENRYINSKSHTYTQIPLQLIYHYINKSNARHINYSTIFFTYC